MKKNNNHNNSISPIQYTLSCYTNTLSYYSTTNSLFSCSQFNQGYPDYFNAFMSDIITARYVIFAFGFLLAVFLSFVYSHVLRFERLSY